MTAHLSKTKEAIVNKTIYTLIVWLIACIIADNSQILAQQKGTPTKDDPVELATIVIQGTEAVEIPGGTKQLPKKTPHLTQQRLDSLNSLEKHTAIRLPAVGLPTNSLARPIATGFVKGEFGQFLTPLIDAGYGFSLGGYRLEANGGIEASNGHLVNADYFNARASLDAEYIAPDKFIFFGGSKTRTFMRFDRFSHELFAMQNPMQRTRSNFIIGVQTHGAYSGYTYKIGGDWGASSLSQSNEDATNNLLHGYIGATKKIGDFTVGADANLRFHTLRGAGLQLIDVLGSAEYMQESFVIKANGGLQSYINANGATFAAFALHTNADYSVHSNLTLGGFLRSGLLENSFMDLMRINPYISGKTAIEFPRENIVVGARLWYHPVEKFSFMMQGSVGSIGNFALWASENNGTFSVAYDNVMALQTSFEIAYSLDEQNLITGNLQARSIAANDVNTLPYIAPIQASIRWDKTWTDKFSSQVSTTYMGVRSTGNALMPQLSGYLDVSLHATYSLANALQCYVRLDNITNSNIYVWEGYKERGIFFAAGILWNF